MCRPACREVRHPGALGESPHDTRVAPSRVHRAGLRACGDPDGQHVGPVVLLQGPATLQGQINEIRPIRRGWMHCTDAWAHRSGGDKPRHCADSANLLEHYLWMSKEHAGSRLLPLEWLGCIGHTVTPGSGRPFERLPHGNAARPYANRPFHVKPRCRCREAAPLRPSVHRPTGIAARR